MRLAEGRVWWGKRASVYAPCPKNLWAFTEISIPVVIGAWMYTCNASSNCVVLPYSTESRTSPGIVTMEQCPGSSELVCDRTKYTCPKSALASILRRILHTCLGLEQNLRKKKTYRTKHYQTLRDPDEFAQPRKNQIQSFENFGSGDQVTAVLHGLVPPLI